MYTILCDILRLRGFGFCRVQFKAQSVDGSTCFDVWAQSFQQNMFFAMGDASELQGKGFGRA